MDTNSGITGSGRCQLRATEPLHEAMQGMWFMRRHRERFVRPGKTSGRLISGKSATCRGSRSPIWAFSRQQALGRALRFPLSARGRWPTARAWSSTNFSIANSVHHQPETTVSGIFARLGACLAQPHRRWNRRHGDGRRQCFPVGGIPIHDRDVAADVDSAVARGRLDGRKQWSEIRPRSRHVADGVCVVIGNECPCAFPRHL